MNTFSPIEKKMTFMVFGDGRIKTVKLNLDGIETDCSALLETTY